MEVRAFEVFKGLNFTCHFRNLHLGVLRLHLNPQQWYKNLYHLQKDVWMINVSKVAKIRNRYNQVPHLTKDTYGKVTNSQKTPQTRAKRSALSQQVTTKHI